MPFIFYFDTFDPTISCIYTDILYCSSKLLHRLDIRIYFGFQCRYFIFDLYVSFLPLWLQFTDMFVHYLCTYIAILSTLLVL